MANFLASALGSAVALGLDPDERWPVPDAAHARRRALRVPGIGDRELAGVRRATTSTASARPVEPERRRRAIALQRRRMRQHTGSRGESRADDPPSAVSTLAHAAPALLLTHSSFLASASLRRRARAPVPARSPVPRRALPAGRTLEPDLELDLRHRGTPPGEFDTGGRATDLVDPAQTDHARLDPPLQTTLVARAAPSLSRVPAHRVDRHRRSQSLALRRLPRALPVARLAVARYLSSHVSGLSIPIRSSIYAPASSCTGGFHSAYPPTSTQQLDERLDVAKRAARRLVVGVDRAPHRDQADPVSQRHRIIASAQPAARRRASVAPHAARRGRPAGPPSCSRCATATGSSLGARHPARTSLPSLGPATSASSLPTSRAALVRSATTLRRVSTRRVLDAAPSISSRSTPGRTARLRRSRSSSRGRHARPPGAAYAPSRTGCGSRPTSRTPPCSRSTPRLRTDRLNASACPVAQLGRPPRSTARPG